MLLLPGDFSFFKDDSTQYITGDSTEDVINSIENDSLKLFKWFAYNQMKANKDKCLLLISGSENVTSNVDGNIIGKKYL